MDASRRGTSHQDPQREAFKSPHTWGGRKTGQRWGPTRASPTPLVGPTERRPVMARVEYITTTQRGSSPVTEPCLSCRLRGKVMCPVLTWPTLVREVPVDCPYRGSRSPN